MERHNVLWFFPNRITGKRIMATLAALICFSCLFALPVGSTESTVNDIPQLAVTGKITDASTGEPMAGVNVLLEGTTIGTISGADGEYKISPVPGNGTLRFSFIGYMTLSVPVNGRNVIDVQLQPETKGLEEIVVVGYGSQKKETLTGSVANVKSDQLISVKSLSVASAIQGKVPGVLIRQQTGEPGVFNSRISVRGFGEPLLVIDGVVRDGMSDFEKLNPEDIESISVLKDAAASIYGLGAANGVFIVTTKKGFAGKTEFNLNTMYSLKTPTNDWKTINVDAYTMRVMWNEMARNSEKPLDTSAEDLEKWKAGNIPGYTDYNWWANVVRDYVSSLETQFSARGGNDVITFFSSFGYNNDQGYFKLNECNQYDRYTFRTNVEAKLAKGLRVNLSFYGRYEDRLQPSRGTTWTFKRIVTNDRGIGPVTLANPNHYTRVPSENTNVFFELSKELSGYDRNMAFQYQSTVDVNYDIPFIKGLTVGLLGAYDGSITDRRLLNKNIMLYDYLTDKPTASTVSPTTFQNTISLFVRKNMQAKMSYRRNFGPHNVSGTLVYEMRRMDNSSLQGQRQYDDVYTIDVLSQGSLTNQSTTGSRGEEAYISYLGRFNYDYKGKYLAEFSFREDGSYRYAPGQRWGFFPALSLGWRIGQEDFFKSTLPLITDMKLRASWGKSGSNAGNAFQYYEGYSFGGVSGGYVFSDGVLTMGMVPPGIVNSNLTWVSTTTYDLGVDIEMWKGKLGVVFDVFRRDENGVLGTRATQLPNTFGASFPQENLNSRWQQGYDMSISHRNSIGKFTYGISASLTYSRTYYKHIEQTPPQSRWDEWKNGNDTYDDKGRIQGRVFGYKRDGIYTNITELEKAVLCGGQNGNYYMLPGMDKIVDVNGDGVLNSNDQLPIMWSGAGTNPPLQFGSTINASYKNIDVVINISGASLYTMYKARGDQWGYGTQYRMFLAKYLDRWHTKDPNANPFDPATEWVPGRWEALTQSTTGNTTGFVTDKWRMDATYLRLKTVEIGYNLPAKYSKAIGLKNLRVYFNGYNFITLCHRDLKDMDPERDEGAYAAGNTYPLMRSYNFGLNIKF